MSDTTRDTPASAGTADDATADGNAGDPGRGRPEALRGLDDDRVRDLDVREELRRGEEPFGRIMAAVSGLPPDGALRLRALFEPVPLYSVLANRGFEHWTEELGPDDWRVWFYRPGGG